MLYLLDSSVLITAQNQYYPIDRVPEFLQWLIYMGHTGNVKIPIEILEEIKEGRKNKEKDRLFEWIQNRTHITALRLDEEADRTLLQRVVKVGYAPDLNDIELEQLGRDPFLIAYAMMNSGRCVVTTEVSKPSKTRQNRKIPDVCQTMGVECCDPFQLIRVLEFSTHWQDSLDSKSQPY